MAEMSVERLREIRERWARLLASTCCINIQVEIPFGSRESEVSVRACAETITNASSDIADLLAEVERLWAECDRRAVLLAVYLRKGVEWCEAADYVGIKGCKESPGEWLSELALIATGVTGQGVAIIQRVRDGQDAG